MAVLDSLFDVLSASISAVIGGWFGFLLNRKDRKRMANQVVVSTRELEKIKLENIDLLKQIQDKENIILQMQMQMLGDNVDEKKARTKNKKSKK
jgi:hypothetical protein